MPLARQFIGWDQPALPVVCDIILQQAVQGTYADLSGMLLVVPSARAKHRILEILIQRCERSRFTLTPPAIETVGGLPEHLYQLKKPFANELTQKMAWVRAMQQTVPQHLQLVFAYLPHDQNHPDWLPMAELIYRLHRELASDVLSFADVQEAARSIDGFAEKDRWKVLVDIQQKYLRILDDCNLWDRQTARSFAIQHHECRSDKQICLIATADINQSLRQMLRQVAARVVTYIFADQQYAERFDEFGCLLPEKWLSAPIELSNDQIIVADHPADQAAAVVCYLQELSGRYRSDQITIALPQPDLEPFIARKLSQHGLSVRFVRGTLLADSPLYKLLESVAEYLRTNRFEEMASLLRHPRIHSWLLSKTSDADFLTYLDKYQNSKLPMRITEFVLSNDEGDRAVQHAHEWLSAAIAPLTAAKQNLADWPAAIQAFLQQVFADCAFNREDSRDALDLQALGKACEVFAEFGKIPASLMPVVSGTQAIRLLLQQMSSDSVRPPADATALEVLGWLDLTLDDAPIAIICGFNDGVIPSSETTDVFLPNSVREKLNVLDNSRRYARDAYALSAVLRSRQHVALIAGRRDADRYPLAPSRLMFATDEHTIAKRAASFFAQPAAEQIPPTVEVAELDAENSTSGFQVPLPDPKRLVIDKLSPTGFREYLACPYRFYLTRILTRHAVIDDRMQEMDGADFGNVMHWVLEEFGKHEIRDSTDPREIRQFFRAQIERYQCARFRNPTKPAVTVQLDNLRLRLDRFAEKQADWRQSGWQIRYTEKEDLRYDMIVDGKPFTINGRVDRIDVQEQSGVIFVFDYKSADVAVTPEKAHFRGNQWVDLQLPLYRHLIKQLPFSGQTKLGYISIPRAFTSIDFYEAHWTEDDLLAADEVAAQVIRDLRNGIYWPPADPAPAFSEVFAPICLDGVFDRPKLPELVESVN